MAQEWKDLNVSVGLAPHLDVCDALCELVMNSCDAAPTSVPGYSTEDCSTVVLHDQGPGLPLESFTVGRTHGDDKVVGRFGLGLKDAVAVLMRHGARVDIVSKQGSYGFMVRTGALGTETIHVQRRAPAGAGTRITVSGLQGAAQSVATVKALFLCWSQPKLLHSSGGVDVLLPNQSGKKHCGKLFVNGVAVTPPQLLHLSYNFKEATSDQRMACDRDHNVEGAKFTKHFQVPIQDALLSLHRAGRPEAAPSKPTCEFAWKTVREKYFPEAPREPLAVRDTRESPQAATNDRQRLCRHLAEMERLCPPPTHPSRPKAVSPSASPLRSGPVTEADVNRLIQATSQSDAVPEGHKNIVSRITTALQVRRGIVQSPCQSPLLTLSLRVCARTRGRASQGCPDLNVDMVFRGGSYAKGTTIGEMSDVDLLVVLNDIPAKNHERWLHILLATLRTIVERAFPGWLSVSRLVVTSCDQAPLAADARLCHAGECQVVKTTRYALQLRFPDVDVDLLPIPAKLWKTLDRQRAIEAMPMNERRWLSVTFAQEQVCWGNQGAATVDRDR